MDATALGMVMLDREGGGATGGMGAVRSSVFMS